jgi:hypothetical protein
MRSDYGLSGLRSGAETKGEGGEMTKAEFQKEMKSAELHGYNDGLRKAGKLLCKMGWPTAASMVQGLLKPYTKKPKETK